MDRPSLSAMSERTVAGIAAGEALGQAPNDVGGLRVVGEPALGPAAGMDHRRVIAPAEGLADGGKAEAGEPPREVHGHLPRPGETGRSAHRDQFVARETERLRCELLD